MEYANYILAAMKINVWKWKGKRKNLVYSKNLEKRRLKKWKNLTESNSTFSKEIKEVELNKSKNVIHNNTSIQRNSHEDSLSVEESTNKVRFITDNCA